jgi:hypothetical protein
MPNNTFGGDHDNGNVGAGKMSSWGQWVDNGPKDLGGFGGGDIGNPHDKVL